MSGPTYSTVLGPCDVLRVLVAQPYCVLDRHCRRRDNLGASTGKQMNLFRQFSTALPRRYKS